MEKTLDAGQYRIPEGNWANFEFKIAKLLKRANKLGVGSVGYRVVRTERVKVLRSEGSLSGHSDRHVAEDAPVEPGFRVIGFQSFRIVEVFGDRPKLAGWKFIGTLQALKDDNDQTLMVLRNVPGETIPEQYRTCEQWCDHCKTRRYRIDTYIVEHEDGRTAQVGSNCLRDFLGHMSPEQIARFAEYLIELDALAESETGVGGGGSDSVYAPTFLAWTAARIRVHGWLGRSKAREFGGEATADRVDTYLFSVKPDGRDEAHKDGVEVTEADEAEAEAALAWIRAQDRDALATGKSDYMWNLFAATLRDDISHRTIGIVASLIFAYQREQGRIAERKQRNAAFANSQFVGMLKQRQVFELKQVAEPVHYDNDFGGSWLTRLEDRDGNQIVWWASGGTAELPAVGEWFKAKATPVKHEERNGVKQTTVNRVALA
jgi:hypothetical protein